MKLERVDLQNGWFAEKWSDEIKWQLKKNGAVFGSFKKLKEIREFLKTRESWRKDGPNSD